LEGLGIENVGLFFGRLENFTKNWHILWAFGYFGYIHTIYFSAVLVYYTKKNLATLVAGTTAVNNKRIGSEKAIWRLQTQP
jgi:hypothetical protein